MFIVHRLPSSHQALAEKRLRQQHCKIREAKLVRVSPAAFLSIGTQPGTIHIEYESIILIYSDRELEP